MNKIFNNAVVVEISSPLLRAGLTIRTTTSEKYAAGAASRLVQIARSINNDLAR